jgi:hypothetical protein
VEAIERREMMMPLPGKIMIFEESFENAMTLLSVWRPSKSVYSALS